jgi:hypothetical protein
MGKWGCGKRAAGHGDGDRRCNLGDSGRNRVGTSPVFRVPYLFPMRHVAVSRRAQTRHRLQSVP